MFSSKILPNIFKNIFHKLPMFAFQKFKPTLDFCVMIVFFVRVNVLDNGKVPEILYAVKAIKRASLIEIIIQSKCLDTKENCPP